MKRILWLSLLWLGISIQAGADLGKAEPEIFHGRSGVVRESAPALRLVPVASAAAAQVASLPEQAGHSGFTLPALTALELAKLKHASGRNKAFQVGLGRLMPATFSQPVDLAQWNWVDVTGGKAAQFILTSSSALWVRAQLQLGELPEGVELRFYSTMDSTAVYGPYTHASLQTEERNAQGKTVFWSPLVEGDALGVEVFLPEGVPPSAVELSFLQLSHMVIDPASSKTKSSVLKATDYSSCQIDIACATPAWQETGNAVARYVFTDTDGQSYLCSGNLLADKVEGSQEPYFFTAAHCINNASAASNMNLFWLYQASTCGGNDAKWQQTTGGAQLLVSRGELDATLLLLNKDPPTGVSLSGWSVDSLTAGQEMTGIHHASGGPKKYAQGNFEHQVAVSTNGDGSYTVTPDVNGDFSQVAWTIGVTAPGSSGSGVWIESGGVHYLKGALLGGGSSCDTPDEPDEYSRFERVYPYVKKWLDTPGVLYPSLSLFNAALPPSALVDGVIIARYLQGVRNQALLDGVTSQTADLNALQTQLANIQTYMDIDDDGSMDADVDGLLLIRYLLGLRDAALIGGLDLSQSGRQAAGISSYIESLLHPAG